MFRCTLYVVRAREIEREIYRNMKKKIIEANTRHSGTEWRSEIQSKSTANYFMEENWIAYMFAARYVYAVRRTAFHLSVIPFIYSVFHLSSDFPLRFSWFCISIYAERKEISCERFWSTAWRFAGSLLKSFSFSQWMLIALPNREQWFRLLSRAALAIEQQPCA